MRAIARLLVLIVMAATLVACGSSSSGKSKDTTAPVISLIGDNPQVIEAGDAYVELGATATDNRDGDLSDAIMIDASQVDTSVPGHYVVTYMATDAAGNSGSASRTVAIEDTTPPVISLSGDNPQAILAGTQYVELGSTAADNIDGDISSNVVVDTTDVDLTMTGSYPVTYDVADSSGNPAATVTRIVRVLVTGEWRRIGSMINEKMSARAVLLADGRVMIVGPGEAEIFDPATETFALEGETPSGVPIGLMDGRILFAGVGDVGGVGPSSVYDPVAGTFHDIGPMNRPRRGFSATLLRDGRVLIVGGENWWPDCEVHDSAEIFDPVTETFTLTGTMAVPRSGHTATLLENGKTLIVGGYDTILCDFLPPLATLRSAELYDPATGMFLETGSMPDSGVFYNTATHLPNGNVLVVAGTEGWEGQKNALYDAGTEAFVDADDMATHRRYHRAVALKSSATCDGPVMIIGGSSGSMSGLSSVEMYDVELGRFYPAEDLPESLAGGHAAILLEDGRVLVAGGYYFENDEFPIPRKTAFIFEPIGGCR